MPKCRPWLLLHSPSTASASSIDVPFAVRVIEYTQLAAIADNGMLVALHPGAAARLPFVEEDLPFVEEDRWKQKVLEPTRVAKGSENKFTMKITIGDFQVPLGSVPNPRITPQWTVLTFTLVVDKRVAVGSRHTTSGASECRVARGYTLGYPSPTVPSPGRASGVLCC